MAERSFGVAVLGGLAAGAAAAVAGSRDWVRVDASGDDAAFATSLTGSADLTAPPVTATALVLLASWGVLLVTRGRVRRALAVLGLVAALAVLAFAVAAWAARPGEVADDLSTLDLDVSRSLWAHLGVLAGVLAVVTSVVAVLRVPRWPEMGRRYDAPTGATGAAAASGATGPDPAAEDRESLELWKALDEGRDPTDPGAD